MKPELRLLSPYVREFKAFLDCGFRIPGTGSGFFLSVELGYRVSIVRGIPDSLS